LRHYFDVNLQNKLGVFGMQQVISKFTGWLRKSLAIFIAGLLVSFAGWTTFSQPSNAAISTPEEALQEIQRDQAQQDRQEFYRQQVEVTEQPKIGAEKEYEQNIEQYYQDTGEGGVVEGAKELVNKVTGGNK
jgi:hypothetical protein